MRLRRFSGISLRNLRARAQRTLLTTIGIVLGVGIVFGVLTLSDTMSSTFSDLYSRAFGAADITVTAAGGSGTFDDSVVEKVRGYEGVESAAPRLSLPASLILDKKQPNGLPEVRSMRLFGVEPESASLATGFELTQGRFPESGREITLDGGSAESTGLKVGDKVTLGTPRRRSSTRGRPSTSREGSPASRSRRRTGPRSKSCEGGWTGGSGKGCRRSAPSRAPSR